MAEYSQSEIDHLISCLKSVEEPPKREMRVISAHRRNDAKLVAFDGTEGYFSAFVRQSIDFPENFSVGLIYHPNDGRSEITLVRCNGKHGIFNQGSDPHHPHFDNHVHKAMEEALESGLRPECRAEVTSEYACLEDAIRYFTKLINLDMKDCNKFFPATVQSDFGFVDE